MARGHKFLRCRAMLPPLRCVRGFSRFGGKRIVRRKESLTRAIFHVERIDSCSRKRLGKNADERLFGGPTTFR